MLTTEALNLKKETEAVEQAVPAHMLFQMMEECKKVGFVLRGDVMQHVNVAAVAPLKNLDELTIRRLALRIDGAATSLLHELSPDDPRDGLYCVAMFCLKLADEMRIKDLQNQAILASLLLIEDLKHDHPTEEVVWTLQEKRWKDKAGKLMMRAVLQGLFLQK